MKITALYKTFSGNDFVDLSLRSIYDVCDKIVMVHSFKSWSGEVGNEVAPVVERWKEQNDQKDKIVNLYTEIVNQYDQYAFGLDYIKKNTNSDYILIIDTDEIWDSRELCRLIDYAKKNADVPAFSVSLHTYIKSIFYRISPKEWCQPTVLIKSSIPSIDGIRGHAIKNKKYLEDVYMHHFTYVRFDENDVLKKIHNTAVTENVRLVNMKDWVANKWNKLPDATDFHTVDYAKKSWQSVKVVTVDDLPEVFKYQPEIFARFMESTRPLTFEPRTLMSTNSVRSFPLRQCSRVGVNVTWKCNWGCETCFYRFSKELHSDFDENIEVLKRQVDEAKKRGCDHVVMVGYGEPSMYNDLYELLDYVGSKDMSTSMITNGSTNLNTFEKLYARGINHIHVSAHGLNEGLDTISHRKGSGDKQNELKCFLKNNKLPWRTNTTIQSMNYQQLPQIIENLIDHNAYHMVLLGFLPHYEWSDKRKAGNVLIPPSELRRYIEEASRLLLQSGRLFTIRYHPFCHIDPELWPYITNAQYVLYDSAEWEYGHHGEDNDTFMASAIKIGNEVSIKKEPCMSCRVRIHCGGWNATYAKICEGAGLRSLNDNDIPDKYKKVIDHFGGLHSMNPANYYAGVYSRENFDESFKFIK